MSGVKLRIPISAKLIFLTTLLLIGVTVPIAFQSSKYFENTSRQREENINLDYAAAKSTEVENILSSIVGKSQVSAALLMKGAAEGSEFAVNFAQDSEILALEIYDQSSGSIVTKHSQVKEEEFGCSARGGRPSSRRGSSTHA